MDDETPTTILLCLNSKGRAIAAVGPFETAEDAIFFFDGTASPAYHGYTLVDLVSPHEYATREERPDRALECTMKVRICARCRQPWTSESGWCSCGEYDKDVMIEVVPAAVHQGAVERAEEAERQREEYREGWLSRGRELNELYDRIANIHRDLGGR